MGVHLNELPPRVREQVARKMVGDAALTGGRNAVSGQGEVCKSKYHNAAETRQVGNADIRFDSKKEARRYEELLALERAGAIRELRLQVDFTLQEAYTMAQTGNRVRAIRYRADFTYWERARNDFGPWELVVEDVKSAATKTRVYEIKKKLMLEKFGIEIREV